MLLASILLLAGLVTFLVCAGALLYRLALFLITRYIQRKLSVKVRIGTLKFFKFFSVQDLYVQLKNGTVFEAERLWISSCIFSNEYSSLVAVCFSDVRLQLSLDGLLEDEGGNETAQGSAQGAVGGASGNRLPAKLVTALKNISLHLYNVDIMRLDGGNDSLVHTTFKELTLNAYSKGKEACALTASVSSAALRIFHQPPDRKRDTCLANACVDAECRLSILLSQPVVLKSLEVDIRNPVLTISENLQLHKMLNNLGDWGGRRASSTDASGLDGGTLNEESQLSRRGRLRGFMLRLPRKVNFSMNSLSFQVMKDNWVPGLSFELVHFTGSLCNDSGAVCNICVKEARFSAETAQLASLALAEMETTLENYCDLSVALKVQSLHTHYNSDEMHYWIAKVGEIGQGINPSHPPSSTYDKDSTGSAIANTNSGFGIRHDANTIDSNYTIWKTTDEIPMKGSSQLNVIAEDGLFRTINASLQVTDLVTSLTPSSPNSASSEQPSGPQIRVRKLNAGVSRFTVELDLQRNLCGEWETQAELLMATGVCVIGPFPPTIQASTLKKSHPWNMPLAFGMCVLQVRDTSQEFYLEGSMNDIHIETTPQLLHILRELLRERRKRHDSNASVQSENANTCGKSNTDNGGCSENGQMMATSTKRLGIELTVTNGNLFALNSVGHYVALRMDTLRMNADRRSFKFVAEESALRVIQPEGGIFEVVPAKLMSNCSAYVKTMTLRCRPEETSIEFAEMSRLWWTTTAYLHVITLIDDTRVIFKSSGESTSSTASTDPPKARGFKLIFCGDSVLEFRLSERHSMFLVAHDFVWKRRPREARISSERLIWRFDKHDIFTFEKVEYALCPVNEESRLLRRHFKSSGAVEQEANRRWLLSFGHIGVEFPHDYNFAEAFSEDFILCFKWMRLVHGKKRVPFTTESPLPADLTVRAKSVSFEIQDDPFEVKLRQNYQLLEDEYFESCKRRQTLDQKIDKLRRTNILISEATIAELYQGLDKMNSEQYIKRSRQLYESSKLSLVHWTFKHLEFSAMADPSFHGKERVVAVIKHLNPNSPLPDDMEFATLWCRVISGSCKSVECRLRDFPRKLLEVDDFFWFGKLVGAEQEGTARAKRTCTIELEAPFGNVSIQRNMPSLKLFYDMTFDLNTFTVVYGSCWEPVLAQVNLALDLINKPSTDPSPPLPWWDKTRLIFHGKLTVSGRRLSYLQHASLNPYNNTEMLDTTWTNAMVYWHNGRIICQGDLDQLIYTASRYYASHLLHFPNLKLSVKMTWRCIGNPFDHQSVMPCAADKLPEYSIHQRHDSYRAFRSTSLNVSISLETKCSNRSQRGITHTSQSSQQQQQQLQRQLEQQQAVGSAIHSGNVGDTQNGSAQVKGKLKVSKDKGRSASGELCTGRTVDNNGNNDDNSETRPQQQVQQQQGKQQEQLDTPRLQLYSATIRWLENFKIIVTGLSRLTRRGKLFGNTRPRKTRLSRHFHSATAIISLHRFQVSCWTSLARHAGFQLDSGRFQLSCEHHLTMLAVRDDFQQIRHKPSWSTFYMNCELSDSSHIWLYHTENEEQEALKRYFLSVSCVSYGRETKLHNMPELGDDETPLHRLAVHGLKGAWTKHNRDVVFGLFDAFINAVNLRRNMTNEALKPFKIEQTNKGQGNRKVSSPSQTPSAANIGQGTGMTSASSSSRGASSKAFSMLEKLIAESEHKAVFTESVETPEPVNLTGVKECQLDDVLSHNWLIELRNSQVMLRGCDTPGYVIVSAAKAQILQRLHAPVWKDNNLVPKTTWRGTLDCMQYYATVENTTTAANSDDDVQWLTTEHIEALDTDITDYADMVGSGHSVGGVVSSDVGAGGCASNGEGTPARQAQLQRIISRCGCQFFYASFGEQGIDPATLNEVPPLPDEKDPDDPWEHEVAVDSFTLIHHDLQVCTNPLQYSMILDLVNNLLLYVEPRRKEANQRLQSMRFELQLEQDKDQRGPIISLQNKARELIAIHKELEKMAYATQRRLENSEDLTGPNEEELRERLATLERDILVKKKQLHATSEDLTLMVNCYRETQVAAWKSQRQHLEHSKISTVRRSEVSFKHALWKLTDEDGQLGIAELVLSNFLYSRTTKSNDSVEHLLELGNIKVTNETPNDVYRDVLQPTEAPSHVPVERQRALRIFCRVRAPVGGISVKEHLEVNIVPISICLTSTLTRRLLTFFFSRKEAEKAVDGDESAVPPKENTRKRGRKQVERNNPMGHDDIEKMKERAANNQTFLYIKIPEVPMRLSYKGEKDKKDFIRDLIDYSLVLPTIELHNRTCRWLDLIIIIRNTAKTALLSQAIKQKLQIKSTTTTTASIPLPVGNAEGAGGSGIAGSGGAGSSKLEVRSETSEEQARLLLFGTMGQGEVKKDKRGFFK
ncbi:protein KIAA0100-like isoform X2 [Varroa jacobsoni]|uniref:FMP27/BLTP2/Hobbit GFWDK motif-containing RBG unit domain-containing protein n=1 Tax=Varroa destructor TaxID=109461 RepID=A0A7M7KHZ4_VARDE|nr:protein KIAA0100-like isoform X2 [Varroa destructor]XP_022700370.1 protein KIAA0100-like isoform X2 [Varroa jacobsoni]